MHKIKSLVQEQEDNQVEDNNFLKRGKGKLAGDIKKDQFYKYYSENAKEKVVERSTYNKFIRDLLQTFSREIVETGLELRINRVGKLRVRSRVMHFFKKNGERSKSLRVNWVATWEYWHTKYPGLTKDQITQETNKTLIYHENDHSNQEYYEHFWDNFTANLKYKSFYTFKASRQYSRLIAQIVKDPNRKTFYYG